MKRIAISRHFSWYDADLAKLREESERPLEEGEYQVRKQRGGFVLVKRIPDAAV